MSGTECAFAHDDAAYVLGALPPAERLAFERHLATCADCAASVSQLAGLPGLLARVPVDVVEGTPSAEPLPETLLPRLLDDVRRAQRRHRRTVTLGAAAAVAVIALASVAVGFAVGDDDGPPSSTTAPSDAPTTAAPQVMTPVGASRDVATVSMTPVAWGTRLDLECSWAEHEEGGDDHAYPGSGSGSYALVVRSSSGDEQQVATWRSVPGRTTRVSAATALDRDDIVSVEVRGEDGRPMFELAG